jgi:hypothetical protein
VELVEGYDRGLPGDSKAAWLASKLGMQLPTTADRYRLLQVSRNPCTGMMSSV